MSEKGIQTRTEILQAAKELFIQKGFTAVTMSDLCEATELSRGGLYRHFSSTKDVFTTLLMNDKNDWEEETKKAMNADFPATKMLSYYLEQVYNGILAGEGGLSLAIYEFERSGQDEEGFLTNRYGYALDMMEHLLQYGQSRNEFKKFNTRIEAEHMVIFIDGLKMAGAAIPLSPDTIKQQLDSLLSRIERKQ